MLLVKARIILSVITVLLLGSIQSDPAFAGAWSAGGGEIIGHTQNPWFLQNTKEVRYCIRGDYANFNLTPELVSTRFKNALAYWREEFRKAPMTGTIGGIVVEIATQNFVEDACPEDLDTALKTHDLVLQLGELSEAQFKFLDRPNRYLGVSVRTDYDVQNMRGKGFIYISADAGSLKYNKKSLVDKAWAVGDGLLLEHVLVHELGHVFGLQHRGETLLGNVMSAGYPEFVLLKHMTQLLLSYPKVAETFAVANTVDFTTKFWKCELTVKARSFFDVPQDKNCLVYKLNLAADEIEVQAKTTAGDVPEKIGSILLKKQTNNRSEMLVKIGVSEDQKVFQRLPLSSYDLGYISGPAILNMEIEGDYVSMTSAATKKTKAIDRFVTVFTGPNSFRIDGLINGKLIKGVER